MPVVYVVDARKGQRRLLSLVFPTRKHPEAPEHERWEWSEVRAGTSAIQGFGLYPRNGGALDWTKLKVPAALPYLGKETEVESSVQARVLRSVLCGAFDVVTRGQLHTPEKHEWVQDGLYVACMSQEDLRKLPRSERPEIVADPEEKLLQVPIEPELSRNISYVEEGDEQVCYLKYEETRQLVHMPPHIFELLSAHADDEHADRNMATHLVQFTRAQGVHLLVSAHPIFRHSAFIMGNANEPPKGPPSLELLELRLVPAEDDDPLMLRAGLTQDPNALAQLKIFKADHPEVLDKSTFFVTRKTVFDDKEELTVVYGNSYKRTYSTWGHSGTPLRYHVPNDLWEPGTWESWAHWPTRVPGWYNVDRQPTNRPAFERTLPLEDGANYGPAHHVPGKIRLLHDLRTIVSARQLGLDGDSHAQRLAKIKSICWPQKLPVLDQAQQQAEGMEFGLTATFRFGGHLSSGLAGHAMTRREFDAPGIFPTPPKAPKQLTAKASNATIIKTFSMPPYPSEMQSDAMEPSAAVDAGAGKALDGIAPGLAGLPNPSITAFTIPQELERANRDELIRLVKAEERSRTPHRSDDAFDEDEEPLTELDWNAPWRFPLGTVAWCKMGGFPFWPCEIVQPAVCDADIARRRKDGLVFVRFYGWPSAPHYWTESDEDCLLSWEEGVRRGFLKLKSGKKPRDKLLERARYEAVAARHARPGAEPQPPPPWWAQMVVGELEMRPEGCEHSDEEDSEEEGEEEEEEEEEEDRPAVQEEQEQKKESRETAVDDEGYDRRFATQRSRRAKIELDWKALDEELRKANRGRKSTAAAEDEAADAEECLPVDAQEAPMATLVQVEKEASQESAATLSSADTIPIDASSNAKIEDALCVQLAKETNHRGPAGSDAEGWREWLKANHAWSKSTAPELSQAAPDEVAADTTPAKRKQPAAPKPTSTTPKKAKQAEEPTARATSARLKGGVELYQLPALPATSDKLTKISNDPQPQRERGQPQVNSFYAAKKGTKAKAGKPDTREGYM